MSGGVRPWEADLPGAEWSGDAEKVLPNGEPITEHLIDPKARPVTAAIETYTVVIDGMATTLHLSGADARRMGLLDGEGAP